MLDVAQLELIDHHCHGVVRGDLGREELEAYLSESGAPPPGLSNFDTQLGFGLRRWCAPVLGLDAFTSPAAYLQRRAELGATEVTRLLLEASGITTFLVDTGYRPGEALSPSEMAAVVRGWAGEVVRLEALAEEVAAGGTSAAGFSAAFDQAMERACATAVGLKSIVAYRYGLDFDPRRPTPAEVVAAAGEWLRQCEGTSAYRLDHPVLLRHIVWAGAERRLPLQFHVGYGDPDLRLHRSDPALLTDFLVAIQPLRTPVMLLHCYPYHRQAGYLAAVFPHVYMDLGLALNYVGPRASALLAEALELTPFDKMLFSSDAFGLPELYYLGATWFRRGLAEVLSSWVRQGHWSGADAERVAAAIGSETARRLYAIGSDRR
jgi:predicted TIM-barrel fold metal-dependent hydrolase